MKSQLSLTSFEISLITKARVHPDKLIIRRSQNCSVLIFNKAVRKLIQLGYATQCDAIDLVGRGQSLTAVLTDIGEQFGAPSHVGLAEGTCGNLHPAKIPISQSGPTSQDSKQSMLIARIACEDGATLSDLMQLTGWQGHTVRAAVSGIRKRGHEVRTEKTAGVTRYRYASAPLALVPSIRAARCQDLAPPEAAVPVAEMSAWPTLNALGLNEAQRLARLSGIGGSDANTIMSGDTDRVIALWREKRGKKDSEDLTGVLPVMLGLWTESFNRMWFERTTGLAVSEPGAATICERHSWRRCTLDGYVSEKSSVWEAKHVSAFSKSDDILSRYMPQLQHNMAVTGAENAILSVLYGNHKWEMYEIASDWMYQDELLSAEQAFWNCVRTGEPPVAPPPPAPPKPSGVREACFTGNPAWSSAASDWIEHAKAAADHAKASRSLKELIEPDVTRAYGHGIEVKRSKAGALSIREMRS